MRPICSKRFDNVNPSKFDRAVHLVYISSLHKETVMMKEKTLTFVKLDRNSAR